MRILFLLLLLITFISTYAANEKKVLILKKTPSPIIIDGQIDSAWDSADSATNFFQLQPYYNQPPSRKTIAKVLTDEDAVYCLMICYDDKSNIQQYTGKLDDANGDVVSFMIDTFNDQRTAYKFVVTASGVRADCRLLDDARNRDYNWDGIWFSDAQIYDWGFVVEMKIPYRSIKYDGNLNYWGLDFDRWRPVNSEDLYWCSYEQNEGQRISKFGKLEFKDFHPSAHGLNLEIYPVGIGKATYNGNGKYDLDPDAGIDIFYNPSPQLTFQLTGNPDFAQIEADPYDFNISRYESYFSERRPFFIEGSEIFSPSGKQRNTGFYSPMELFYSRRIGKKLPDGIEVPLSFGTKAFGKLGDWEYGGFVARTEETNYMDDTTQSVEPRAYFASARLKKQIMGNSSIGVLYVGKYTAGNTYGVLDIDGAFRESSWQLAYQFARSFKNNEGGYAASAGFTKFGSDWVTFARVRHVGKNFDIDQIGYVPWKGTTEFASLSGPIWFPETGNIRQILIYGGLLLYNEQVDNYTDHAVALGYNMQFRDNWGFEVNFNIGKSKDEDKKFDSYEISLSSWFNTSPNYSANLWGGYSKTYNFSRDYLAFYSWLGSEVNFKATDILDIGTSFNMWVEGDPNGNIADITYNARPYFSFTPINDLNLRVYVDNVYLRSSKQLEHVILGVLFSYQFLPKSWIYFAYNDYQNRDSIDRTFQIANRASVLKVKYLYYF